MTHAKASAMFSFEQLCELVKSFEAAIRAGESPAPLIDYLKDCGCEAAAEAVKNQLFLQRENQLVLIDPTMMREKDWRGETRGVHRTFAPDETLAGAWRWHVIRRALHQTSSDYVRVKVRLTNTFHGTSTNVLGELIGYHEDGMAHVRLTYSQYRRVVRNLCGVDGCRCGRHMPSFEMEDDENYHPTCKVVGEPNARPHRDAE